MVSQIEEELIVRLKDISKVYSQGAIEVHALKRVSLEITKGSFMSICGPSGSGKTTLLNLIGGLDTPSEGEIEVADKRVDRMSRAELSNMRLREIGFVFQSYNLIPVLNAAENISFVLQLQGEEGKVRRERARELLVEVGLEGLEKRRPAELSGGQQQRVAIARAIASNPSIILADEPTANLDSRTAAEILELMLRLNLERGTTFLFSTHDSLVMSYASRLVRLHDGEIESDEIKEQKL